MNADPLLKPAPASEHQAPEPNDSEAERNDTALPESSVFFKSDREKLLLTLPKPDQPNLDWTPLWEQIQQQIKAGQRFWQANAEVELVVSDRLLDQGQLQMIAASLDEVQLKLRRVQTSRRQTAIAAAAAGYGVEQQSPTLPLQSAANTVPLDNPLYLETTIRSGTEIRHHGHVVIVGDINPGGSVIATGDILVWGRLRGVAHAGAQGNIHSRIMALQIEATQLRIANQVARTPKPPDQFYPEVAYVSQEGIKLARATEFGKNIFVPPQEAL
jgi:septum site-determining protein MinC